jgi:hypothetical protein
MNPQPLAYFCNNCSFRPLLNLRDCYGNSLLHLACSAGNYEVVIALVTFYKTFYGRNFFWFNWVLDQGPEQRESKLTVLYQLFIIILISYIIIYYIIIKLLIMENHPSQNRKWNSTSRNLRTFVIS